MSTGSQRAVKAGAASVEGRLSRNAHPGFFIRHGFSGSPFGVLSPGAWWRDDHPLGQAPAILGERVAGASLYGKDWVLRTFQPGSILECDRHHALIAPAVGKECDDERKQQLGLTPLANHHDPEKP